MQLFCLGREGGACPVLQYRGAAEERARLCSACCVAHTLCAGCLQRVLFWCLDGDDLDFSPLVVFAIPFYMATFARSAPLPENNTLKDPASQEIVQRSRSLIQKILLSIPDTHKSCIHTEVRDSRCAMVAQCFLLTMFHAELPCWWSASVWANKRASAWFSLLESYVF